MEGDDNIENMNRNWNELTTESESSEKEPVPEEEPKITEIPKGKARSNFLF